MNRRRFLGSVPVLAVAGLVASVFGRLFGRETGKPFSAGRLRREPELMGGAEEEPESVDVGLGIYHCKPCQQNRAAVEYDMKPAPTGGKDGWATFKAGDVTLTLDCGHTLAFTAAAWERERRACC